MSLLFMSVEGKEGNKTVEFALISSVKPSLIRDNDDS